MKILVISPHPDDAELGMGGTVARLLGQGHAVTICDLTSGEPTPHGDEATRKKETAAANAALGNPARLNLGLPNRWLEATIENRVKLAEVIRTVRPDFLFVPYQYDAHPDHLAAHLLAQQARFTAKLTKTEMAGQPHYPRRLIYYFCTHLMLNIEPTFVIDISGQIEAKTAAIACYRSQFYAGERAASGPVGVKPVEAGGSRARDLPEMVKTLCRYFGQRIGAEYGEPFYIQEVLGLSGLDGIV